MAQGVRVKAGNLVRYKKFPHEELYDAGHTGLVLTDPAPIPNFCDGDVGLEVVDVMWSARTHLDGEVTWDYVNEIEVISESR